MASRELSHASSPNPLSSEELHLIDAWFRACKPEPFKSWITR